MKSFIRKFSQIEAAYVKYRDFFPNCNSTFATSIIKLTITIKNSSLCVFLSRIYMYSVSSTYTRRGIYIRIPNLKFNLRIFWRIQYERINKAKNIFTSIMEFKRTRQWRGKKQTSNSRVKNESLTYDSPVRGNFGTINFSK